MSKKVVKALRKVMKIGGLENPAHKIHICWNDERPQNVCITWDEETVCDDLEAAISEIIMHHLRPGWAEINKNREGYPWGPDQKKRLKKIRNLKLGRVCECRRTWGRTRKAGKEKEL